MVTKLKQSMMDGTKIRILRDSIKRVEESRDMLLFGMEIGEPYMFHLENIINEKMVVIIPLEGLRHCPTDMSAKEYFNEL